MNTPTARQSSTQAHPQPITSSAPSAASTTSVPSVPSIPSPAALAPAALNLIIPQEVRYDGLQPTPRGNLLQFTNLQAGPAHGATFYLLEREATSVILARLTAQVRRSFTAPPSAKAAPTTSPAQTASAALPPAFQRHPRRFAAPETNHY
jgi:hypothetical protein